MAARWPRGCRLPALPALLLSLLLLLLGSRETQGGITCPAPTSVEHADIRVKSYSLSSRERYTCNSGFKRKAGTSSLTECVLNETTNTAHWTTPNLKCIRDPSLARQMPVSPSTVSTTSVTTQPQSFTPSRKEFPTEPEASTPKSETAVTTEATIVTDSRLTPSESPSTGITGTGRNESPPAPSQTAAKTLEPMPSAFYVTPDASSGNTTTVTSPSTAAIVVVVVVFILLTGIATFLVQRRQRQHPPTPNVEMDNMEDMPMTGEASNREENTEDHQRNL